MKTTKRLRPAEVALVVIGLALSHAAIPPAAAERKRPRPYKSEEGMVIVAHSLLIDDAGTPVSVTLKEFEEVCALPRTNGVDAFVYKVPSAYQKIRSDALARGAGTVAWGLYFLMYDKSCALKDYAFPEGNTLSQTDTRVVIPPGIAWVAISNLEGDPVTVWWEAKPTVRP